MPLTISKRPVEPEFNSYVLYRDLETVLLVVYDLYAVRCDRIHFFSFSFSRIVCCNKHLLIAACDGHRTYVFYLSKLCEGLYGFHVRLVGGIMLYTTMISSEAPRLTGPFQSPVVIASASNTVPKPMSCPHVR